ASLDTAQAQLGLRSLGSRLSDPSATTSRQTSVLQSSFRAIELSDPELSHQIEAFLATTQQQCCTDVDVATTFNRWVDHIGAPPSSKVEPRQVHAYRIFLSRLAPQLIAKDKSTHQVGFTMRPVEA